MSSVVFLISMGFVIYFLIQGDKQDKLDRECELTKRDGEKKINKNSDKMQGKGKRQ